MDRAAITFSQTFYDEVFVSNTTICEAFSIAQDVIERDYGKFQANKLKLLTKCDKDCCTYRNTIPRQDGIPEQVGINSELLVLPNKVTPFMARNSDMLDVLKLLTQNDIIQIFGMPGLGKSSLLKNVTCFLGERDIYKDGILYIDFLHVTTFNEAIQIMKQYFEDDVEYNP